MLPCHMVVSVVWVHGCVAWLVWRNLFTVGRTRWSWIDEGINVVVLWGLL